MQFLYYALTQHNIEKKMQDSAYTRGFFKQTNKLKTHYSQYFHFMF